MPQADRDPQDERFMLRALHLAASTAALSSPNPQVGCVLVHNNQILAEGAHLYQDYDHAEVAALKQAAALGRDTHGSTAYVTLEPCSHHGRTGPCADALIAAGIARCVIATQDPNPEVSGRGISRLQQSGIHVTLDVCRQQARELNDAFARFIRSRRPFVTLKAALSADGYLAPAPAHRLPGQPFWLTGEAARRQVQLLRHHADAILTGIGTVLADDPALTDRSNLLGPRGLTRRRPLLRVILDTHLRTPLHSQIVRLAKCDREEDFARSTTGTRNSASDLLILCGDQAPASAISALEKNGAEVQMLPQHAGRLSLPAVLDSLAHRSCISLLLECGSHLNGAFLTQNLVDKVVLYYGGQTLGDQAIPFARGISSPHEVEQQLTSVNRAPLGPDAVVTGYLRDPWAAPPPDTPCPPSPDLS